MTRAVVVAAPASGSGKTTVATGLMAALRRRGTSVAPFKVGPDYIDPGYHTLASGRPGRNLDPVLVGECRIAPLFRHGAASADVAVVEGVMGLFDGRLADGHGSTAHVAGLLGAPVVLVVDCRGQSRSVAALLHGFRSFDPARRSAGGATVPRARIAGVVLNRVGSDRHEAVLRAACDEVGLPVLGALPRRAELAVPSRHLGLVTAAEHGAAATAAVEAMAELVASHVDLDAVIRLAEPIQPGPVWDPVAELVGAEGAPPDVAKAAPGRGGSGAEAAARDRANAALGKSDLPNAAFARSRCAADPPNVTFAPSRDAADRANDAFARSGQPVVVAIAGGPAFTFGYAEHAELLAAAGCAVAVVDPLRDEALPPGTAALVLPGGFPEEHVAALSANVPLRAAVADLAASGAPVHAECGGLLYLSASLDGAPLCGVLPAAAAMTDRLTLGYRAAVALVESVPFTAGARVAGHEFHRCVVTPRAGTDPAWGWRGGEPEGFVTGGVHASFLHTHPASAPVAVARFARAAATAARNRTTGMVRHHGDVRCPHDQLS